jgi:hypothetical protein
MFPRSKKLSESEIIKKKKKKLIYVHIRRFKKRAQKLYPNNTNCWHITMESE